MKIQNYEFPSSSFLAMEKDSAIIVGEMLRNNRFKNLLFYTTKDCLSRPPLNEDETLSLIDNNIKLVPKIKVDSEVLNYVSIDFDSFTKNSTNPQFRDSMIQFSILCNYNQWHLKDYQLRPYKIAAEIDTMFSNKHLTGIGTLEFFGAQRLSIDVDYGGFYLLYKVIHGGEDKTGMPNPIDEEQFIKSFNEMYNDD